MKRLYIIHGWTYTVSNWDKTLANLRKEGLQVKMLLVPGLTAESRKVWTVEEYAKWAAKNIPDGAVALGHSNGGRILLNMLTENPEKLSHLILLNSAGVYRESKKRNTAAKLSKIFAPLKKIPLLRKIVHRVLGVSDYHAAPKNMKKTLVNMINSDKELDLTKVTTETTILWGEDDKVTPVADAELMHKTIPHSRKQVMPRWGHAPYITHPAGLADEILKIMKGL